MTLIIDLPVSQEEAVAAAAKRLGVPVKELAAQMFARGFSEWIQDELDNVEASRVLAETKPDDWISWDDLKKEILAERMGGAKE